MKIIDFLRRYIKNLATLNNLKHRVDILEEQNSSLKSEVRALQEQNKAFKTEIDSIENIIESAVAKQIFYQSLSLGQRVDQFIFDANIELSGKITSKD
ncbi:hypothetical protein [Sulfurimonas sp.]|jgi:FtsZ-binding cell division protein ZapB|uniref:hypothetical protein n=1 Tax=Sulfurimonas sp. TaxID=2022749 RepID=UPI0025D019E1|nr:hypothetical protein [Sulfurimonas sp.]MCK9474028.1 cell division protein ZapB [Sulfurimonas sp.]MDD3505714.1 hypothetical protein [Sulfurimonas sp.]